MSTSDTERTWVTVAETAKLVRQALKREFPGTKFSVRSQSYAGGASIDVYWTDGPTKRAVEAIVDDYEGGRFDGQQDLAYAAQHWLTPDGVATVARIYGHTHDNETVTPDRPEGARLVRFAADHVFANRELSDAFVDGLAELAEPNGRDSHGGQCRKCGDWPGTDHVWWTLAYAGRDGEPALAFACSARCAAVTAALWTDARDTVESIAKGTVR